MQWLGPAGLKIWTSDLDSYRLLCSTTERNQWMTDQRFWDGLTGESPETMNQVAGSAWHYALETTTHEKDGTLAAQDLEFNDQRYTFHAPPKGTIVGATIKEQHFELEIGGHLVTGRCDGLTQNSVIDYKTSFKGLPDPDMLTQAWQWRVYLLAFSRPVFWYNTFALKLRQGWPASAPYGADDPDNRDEIVIDIVDSDAFLLYRYPDMESDVEEFVRDFAEYTSFHGWPGRPRERHKRKKHGRERT